MGVPKIKLYQLERGYSEDADNDIQQILDDELIPLKDKPVIPDDFYKLTGIKTVNGEPFAPVNFSEGKYSASLIPNNSQFQVSSYGHNDILISPSGVSFGAIVKDHNLNPVPASGYILSPSGVFFKTAPFPSGAIIEYWRTASEPTTHFVTMYDDVYDGNNWTLRPVVFDDNQEVVSMDDYQIVKPSGLIIFNNPQLLPSGTYSYKTTLTQYFVGDRENWIENHLYLSPDVFKGMYDYPGDDAQDSLGNPVVQGPIPKHVESDEYQIDFRKGMVVFNNEVDDNADPVYASYACCVGIRNATSQILTQISADPSGGYIYKAVNDKLFPESNNSMWVNKNNSYLPRNFYVDGVLKPQIKTVQPFDTLTIKNS